MGKERGDIEIKDYVVFQKPQEQTDRLPPPSTLIMDFTLTHTCFERSQGHSLGQLTHTSRSDGAPEPDGALREVARSKIRHYRQMYINHPDTIGFMSVTVDKKIVFTMTLVSSFFRTHTVKPRIWLMRY